MKELLQREYHSISFFSYVLPETFVTVITEKRAGANAVKLLERSVPAESFPVFSGGGINLRSFSSVWDSGRKTCS